MSLILDAAPPRPLPLDLLRGRLRGTVHDAADPDYAPLVTPWNVAVPMRPQVVVAARTALDAVAGRYDQRGVLQAGRYLRFGA